MSTPNIPGASPVVERGPLRLRMASTVGHHHVDGGWWPQSRDLTVELPDLVADFPPQLGRVVRALVSPPDWDATPRRVTIGGGRALKVGSFPRDDTHLVVLTTSDRTVLRVLVVPPDFTPDQGEEALLAAATPGYPHTAGELLAEVLDEPAAHSRDRWDGEGGAT